jgi:hypothetical protein
MLKCHTNETAKPPKGSRGKTTVSRQLSLWGAPARTVSKTAVALDEHSLRDISVLWTSAAKRLDLPAVQAVESKCRALSVFISSGVAATHGRIKDLGLSHPSDVAAYLILRELDDKGRREFRSTASRSSTSALRRSWACKYRGQVRMLSA